MRLKQATLLLLIIVSLAGCSVRPPAGQSSQAAANPEGYSAVLATTDLGVGRERFTFALFQPNGSTMDSERLVVHFYLSVQGKAEPKGDALASYEIMGLSAKDQESGETPGQIEVGGIYVVSRFNFEQAGTWVATIESNKSSTSFKQPVSLVFQVAQHSATPAIGELVPNGPTPVGSTPAELKLICSSDPPDNMHQVSVDQALAGGSPFVLAFSTPSFCRSRLCGPVTELVQSVEAGYRGRLDFIHVEPYDLAKLRNGGTFELVPSAKAWGLPVEPWVFVVDRNGRLVAKFEGMLSRQELEKAIEQVIQ